MANANKQMQVYFLPWFKVSTPITIGAVTVWPYYHDMRMKRISSAKNREFLDRAFNRYVNLTGRPVDSISICSHEVGELRSLTEAQEIEALRAVDVLAFATISSTTGSAVRANNSTTPSPSANLFQLVNWKFTLDAKSFCIDDGPNTCIGTDMGDITFQGPLGVGRPYGHPEDTIISGFNQCFSAGSSISSDISERLFRSLEWFRLAHVEGGQSSHLSRVVMMSTAFEILLDFPNDRNKAFYFADWLDKRIACGITYGEAISDTRLVDKKNNATHTLVGWWGWDFYKLRNKIVHGNEVSPSDLNYSDWRTHLIVADVVFHQCMIMQLFHAKFIGDDVREGARNINAIVPHPFGRPISPEEWAYLFYRFGEVHEALGWLREWQGATY